MTTIPPLPLGAEVLYGFRAEDSSGNIYTETPCLVGSWPPEDDQCMFELSIDEPPIDDEKILIPDDFDFISFKGGVDLDHVYFEIEVQGNISAGTISPTFVHIYGFGLANPDKGDPADIVSQGFLGVYAPNAEAFSYLECMVIYEHSDDIITDDHNIECATDGESRLWFKVNNRQIGDTPSGIIKVLAADGAVTSITPLGGMPYDYTHVSSIALMERWLVVQ